MCFLFILAHFWKGLPDLVEIRTWLMMMMMMMILIPHTSFSDNIGFHIPEPFSGFKSPGFFYKS
jgi:hypothetical protein